LAIDIPLHTKLSYSFKGQLEPFPSQVFAFIVSFLSFCSRPFVPDYYSNFIHLVVEESDAIVSTAWSSHWFHCPFLDDTLRVESSSPSTSSHFQIFANQLPTALQSIIMSAWGTGDMAAALPDATTEQPAIEQSSEAPAAEKKADPQAYGWAAPTKYDYETFNKTNKELEEAQASAQPTENQAE
jgi:hypothetical protein